jgi:hypothetical protein
MTTVIRPLTCGLVLLVVLAAALETPVASVRIASRYLVLSFDSPTTQVLDDLVCESSPPSQAGAEAVHWTRLAARTSARFVVMAAPACASHDHFSSRLTRAPPTA